MISKDMLSKIIESLSSMIDYADDGSIPCDDEDFSDFFKSVDNANDILNKLSDIYALDSYSYITNKQVEEIWNRESNNDDYDDEGV